MVWAQAESGPCSTLKSLRSQNQGLKLSRAYNIAGTRHLESQCCGVGFTSSGISKAHEVIPHGTALYNESKQQKPKWHLQFYNSSRA